MVENQKNKILRVHEMNFVFNIERRNLAPTLLFARGTHTYAQIAHPVTPRRGTEVEATEDFCCKICTKTNIWTWSPAFKRGYLQGKSIPWTVLACHGTCDIRRTNSTLDRTHNSNGNVEKIRLRAKLVIFRRGDDHTPRSTWFAKPETPIRSRISPKPI